MLASAAELSVQLVAPEEKSPLAMRLKVPQTPPEQVCVPGHALPHALQFALLVCKLTQVPQSV
jgi:hypothetical protein